MRNREHSRLNCLSEIVLTTMLGFVFMISAASAQATEPKSIASHVEFTDVPLKEAIKNLAKQLKINLVFDESFRDIPKYSLELEGVSHEAALKIILVQCHLSARIIEENTIIVFYNNENNRTLFSAYPKWPAKIEKNQ